MKAFFAKEISVEEIQGKTKKLLKGSRKSCAEILENIHTDNRNLESGELLRESTLAQANPIMTRRETKDDAQSSSHPHTIKGIPHNVENLLPCTYYL